MSQPPLGISGLLNVLPWVEHWQQARASAQKEGDALGPISHPTMSPPPVFKQALDVWAVLPQIHRQHLLWLLSHLLERQIEQHVVPSKEVSDERDERAE